MTTKEIYTPKKITRSLEDVKVNVKIMLAGTWAALMFIYIYVDFFDLHTPGDIEHILAGKVGTFSITQTSLFAFMLLMLIPSLMIFLSLALKPNVNRWTNIIIASLYMVVAVGNIVDETWVFYIFAVGIEMLLLAFIVWNAWMWPRSEA